MKITKIPKAALAFNEEGCFARVDGEEGVKLDMTIYSGKIMKGHWWWGNLALDLSGMEAPKSKYPILENHMTSHKIGFSGKPVIENNSLKLNPDTVTFVETEESQEFQKLSKAGFPYESSLYGQPFSIERVEEGTTVDVNGYKFKGPGSIWRKWVFKEASVCVFGTDSNTRSRAFSDEECELNIEEIGVRGEDPPAATKQTKEKEVKVKMFDIKKFQEENPEGYEALKVMFSDQVRAELEKEFKLKEDGFKSEIENLKTQLSGRDDRILKLEKNDAIRAEKEMKATADSIWATKLAASEVPEHLYGKVANMVPHAKFVADGVLDTEKFGEAVDAEIKDWEDKGITSSVLGTGFTSKNDVDSESAKKLAEKKDSEDRTNRLLEIAGQKAKAE